MSSYKEYLKQITCPDCGMASEVYQRTPSRKMIPYNHKFCPNCGRKLKQENEHRHSPKPEALTLAQLADAWRNGEPIYAKSPDGSPIWMRKGGVWCVLDGREVAGTGFQLMAVFGHNLTLAQSDYGKTWLAYTHKPETEGDCGMPENCSTCVYAYPSVNCADCGTGFRNYRERILQTNADITLSNLKDIDCLTELIWGDSWHEVFNMPDFDTKQELANWLRQPKED